MTNLCECGHDERAHRRPIISSKNKACGGVKLRGKDGEKLTTNEPCDCKQFKKKPAASVPLPPSHH